MQRRALVRQSGFKQCALRHRSTHHLCDDGMRWEKAHGVGLPALPRAQVVRALHPHCRCRAPQSADLMFQSRVHEDEGSGLLEERLTLPGSLGQCHGQSAAGRDGLEEVGRHVRVEHLRCHPDEREGSPEGRVRGDYEVVQPRAHGNLERWRRSRRTRSRSRSRGSCHGGGRCG